MNQVIYLTPSSLIFLASRGGLRFPEMFLFVKVKKKGALNQYNFLLFYIGLDRHKADVRFVILWTLISFDKYRERHVHTHALELWCGILES